MLCGLPIRRPPREQLIYERRNGRFVLQITGRPELSLPFGQDRLVPIFLATLAVRQQSQAIRFRSASQMLETFGMAKGGRQYRRLVAAFESSVSNRDRAQSDEIDNVVVLSDEFYEEFIANSQESIPLFGPAGLAGQLGCVEYSRPRRFRAMLELWLGVIRGLWPGCPAEVGGDRLIIDHGTAITPRPTR